MIVAAMRSPGGASAAILRAARQSKITLLVSVPLAIEYEATCSEAEHRLAAGLSEREVEIFLDAVVAMAEPVKTHFLWRPQLRDPSASFRVIVGWNPAGAKKIKPGAAVRPIGGASRRSY